MWTENILNPKRQGCTQAFLAPVIAAFSNFSGVMWTENFWCVFRVKNLGVVWIEPNSSYCSWACGQIFLCLKRHTNEAKGSIQCRITLSPRLYVKPLITSITAIFNYYYWHYQWKLLFLMRPILDNKFACARVAEPSQLYFCWFKRPLNIIPWIFQKAFEEKIHLWLLISNSNANRVIT